MSNYKIHICLVSGKQGSGKTTTAKKLLAAAHRIKGWRAELMNFADPIYEIHNHARGLMQSYGLKHPENVKVKDGPFLQYLGTEWGRTTYGEDVWVNALKARIDNFVKRMGDSFPNYLFIVGDCRFLNEFEAFPNALRVRLQCPEHIRQDRAEQWRTNKNHISETNLDDVVDSFDLIIPTHTVDADGVAELILANILTR